MTTTHRLDWADIQGNILRGYNLAVARHCFYRVTNATRARELLASLLPEVTTAEDERQDGAKWSDGSKPHSTLNIAMTYAGLAALGVPEPALFAFPPEFRRRHESARKGARRPRAERAGELGCAVARRPGSRRAPHQCAESTSAQRAV